VEEVFAALAGAHSITIFAPTYLPAGAVVADRWFPVIGSSDPASYQGQVAANPRIVGSGPDVEIEVVLEVGEGWLAVLENFRGDLGDVSGSPVGTVAGNPATVFDINGGHLVQWSLDGLWYGVFGRGVSRDAMIAVALGMQAEPY
jgi:hypothetical protein